MSYDYMKYFLRHCFRDTFGSRAVKNEIELFSVLSGDRLIAVLVHFN